MVSQIRARLSRATELFGSQGALRLPKEPATAPDRAPWALRLVTDRLPVGPAPYASVALDPVSLTARYTDAEGQPVEMGNHGTSRTTGTASVSGGGDGQGPQPQTQDDHTTDYESD
ncbi:putative ATP-grasp-modified RiPP [Streptomyces sp. NPDC014983]|uniref:putative ATP-grasp-modified RiPP n=1 Tax=Streptomyces sp. NPDC014983 TaxID=3364933 RepID=UPI003700E7B2